MTRRAIVVLAVLAAFAACAPAVHAGPPRVEVFVAGRDEVLQEPVKVRAKAVTVRVGGRSCAVAAGTALAALEAARRSGGPSFAVRDFGACSSRASDAAGLFVSRIGPDSNRDRDGWVYKVGPIARKVGSAGAADAAGPFGTGKRVVSRSTVTWFWCETQSSGGCQRTLEVTARTFDIARGASFKVGVRGYDDRGRSSKPAGVTIRFAGGTALTDANGRARLTAPSVPGRYRLVAEHEDMVRSIPRVVVVR